MKPVVIVGAGLAGLTCARTLKRNGIPFLLIEGDDRVGGRLKTDLVGNYYLDRGYQVYFTAYPTARNQVDEEKLHLQRFEPGCYVLWDGEQHLVSREKPFQFAVSGFLSVSDKLRLAKWTSDLQWLDEEDIAEMEDRTIESYLLDEGFSDEFIDRFARPLLGGIFLDRTVSTSCRQLAFVWKVMSEGEATIPAQGMEMIPKQLSATFGPDVLRLGTRVVEIIKRGGTVVGVKLDTGEEIDAEQVVLACDAPQVSALSGIPFDINFRHSITLYFTAPQQPIKGGWLVLNGNMRGITNHVVPMSNVNPLADQLSKHLVSATILGERQETDAQLAEIVKSEMRLWFPNHDAESWELLRGYRLRNAQMVQPPGFKSKLPGNESAIPGLYFAGEFTRNSSIDGAMHSGLDCAELLVDKLKTGIA